MPSLKQNQFYCVCCGKAVTIKPENIRFVKLKNPRRPKGVPALRGKCEDCGCNLVRFIKNSQAESFKKKYS